MNYRPLGNTGLEVSELGLGGLFVSSLGKSPEENRRVVLRAMELGINYIDTAPGYADSEQRLGEVLRDHESPVIISTKLGGRPAPFRPKDADGLMYSVEESLRLLNRETIDLLMIHEPDRPGQYDWWDDQVNAQGPVMDVLDRLKESGSIRHTGIAGTSSTELANLARTGRFEVVLTAFNYSVLYREAELEIFPAALENGMGIILGSVLQQGALARRYDDVVRARPYWMSKRRQEQILALYGFSDETGIALPELGVRFALSNPHVSSVLVGPKTAEQMSVSVASANKGPLDPDHIDRLEVIASMLPYRPFEEPMVLPFGIPYFGPGGANLGGGGHR